MVLLRKLVFGNNLKTCVRASSAFTKVAESVYGYHPSEESHGLLEKFPKATEDMKKDFHANGYVLVKNLITKPELDKLIPILIGEQSYFAKLGYYKQDRKWGMAFWNEQGEDVLGILAGNSKTAGVAHDLLDRGEIYLYHGKLLRKEAKEGGSSEWHQDYGQYYLNELVFPELVSCTIALTKSDRENGGTSIIKASHRCGRIDHGVAHVQSGADPVRLDLVKRVLPQVDVDLAPGDGAFFHTNLLRCSGPNKSDNLRCHLKFVFNTRENSPAIKHDYSDAVYVRLHTYPADLLPRAQNLNIQKREWLPTEKDRIDGLSPTSLMDF